MSPHGRVCRRMGEFALTLKDFISTMALPLYGETNTMGLTLEGENKDKLQLLIEAASSTKSSYTSWIQYFDEEEASRNDLILEALLAYCLSWFIFPCGPEDSLNSCLLLLAVLHEKERKMALAPIYPGSLYARLDECVTNLTRFLRHYDVVSHVGYVFL